MSNITELSLRWPGRTLALVMLALALLGALVIGGRDTQAVHDLGLFELDRNAEQDAAPGDDWDTPPTPAPGVR